MNRPVPYAAQCQLEDSIHSPAVPVPATQEWLLT